MSWLPLLSATATTQAYIYADIPYHGSVYAPAAVTGAVIIFDILIACVVAVMNQLEVGDPPGIWHARRRNHCLDSICLRRFQTLEFLSPYHSHAQAQNCAHSGGNGSSSHSPLTQRRWQTRPVAPWLPQHYQLSSLIRAIPSHCDHVLRRRFHGPRYQSRVQTGAY